jgi:hypothetical protein
LHAPPRFLSGQLPEVLQLLGQWEHPDMWTAAAGAPKAQRCVELGCEICLL